MKFSQDTAKGTLALGESKRELAEESTLSVVKENH